MMVLRDMAGGPMGAVVAIALMAAATYLFRASGVALMSRVRITPRIERGLRALPGSIVLATVLPIVAEAGLPALAGVTAALIAMSIFRFELAALAAGLAAVTLVRGLGL